ncbi:MAG: PRC-barrel domain-containing protein [Betaproteobacteria bacterium]
MTPQRSVGFAIPSTSSTLIGAESCLGCAIVDRQGTAIGELRDIMLDLSTGRIAYAVVELIASGTASSRALIVVPWNAVAAEPDAQQLRINAHADWIERAPSVQRGSEPDRFVHEWGAFIHNYFGTRPYWEAPHAAQHS